MDILTNRSKNDFAPLPPMGWNSYDYYDTTVDEAALMRNAAYMAEHLKEYGWEYVVADIQWYAHDPGSQRERFQYIPFGELELDEWGRLLPDPKRFPSSAGGAGFKPLADYVHSLGLKFGIHIMRGIPRIAAHLHLPVAYDNPVTRERLAACPEAGFPPCPERGLNAADVADPASVCGWNPDMYGVGALAEGQVYYDSLLSLYASWGVDFIKCDDICNTNLYPHRPYSARHEVEMLSRAIRHCGRDTVLSLSPGPALIEEAWHYETYANMWRITDDFWDDWRLLKDMFKRCQLWQSHVSRGCYPDCDMLPLGVLGKGFGRERNTNFTWEEQRTMMTLWCLFGSPLMLGAELTKLDKRTLTLLTNSAVLAMRDPRFRPRQLRLTEFEAVWTASDASGEICPDDKNSTLYVALFNLSDEKRRVSVPLAECGVRLSHGALCLRDLWEDTLLQTRELLQAELAPHACAAYRLL